MRDLMGGSAVDDPHAVGFDELAGADLVVDRIYKGGTAGNAGDDPLARLLPVGNQGGFRTQGYFAGQGQARRALHLRH